MKKRIVKILLIVLVIYVGLQLVPYGKSHKKSVFAKQDEVLIIAHGGGKQLNPENTWMAFDYAYELGSDVLEMDIQLTADGKLACVHNENIEDYANAKGKVHDYTLSELESMNFGYHFQDLDGNYPYVDADLSAYGKKLAPANVEGLFQKFGKNVAYIIEIKDDGELGKLAAEELSRLIAKYDMHDYVCSASFSNATMNEMRKVLSDEDMTSFDLKSATSFIIANYVGVGIFFNYPHSGFQLPMEEYGIPLATKYLIYKIHKNDMFVHYWTINTKEEMRKCIENGADGIITDRMDLLIEVLAEYR